MNHRYRTARSELGYAADIAGRDQLRPDGCDVGQLPVAQLCRDLWLQHVVGSGRSAAEMCLRDFERLEARLGEKSLRGAMNALAVLHRAGGVIRDTPVIPGN